MGLTELGPNEMSANDRSARHHAVCGSKPGGADAYYLKETCARKDGRPVNAARATAAGGEHTTMQEFALMCLNLLGKVRNFVHTQFPSVPKSEHIRASVVRSVTTQALASLINAKRRRLSLIALIRKAVNQHNAEMARVGSNNVVQLSERLLFEVIVKLEFALSASVAMVSGAGRADDTAIRPIR